MEQLIKDLHSLPDALCTLSESTLLTPHFSLSLSLSLSLCLSCSSALFQTVVQYVAILYR